MRNYQAREFVYGSMRITLSEVKRPTVEALKKLNQERRPLQQEVIQEPQVQVVAQVASKAAPEQPKQASLEQASVGFAMISKVSFNEENKANQVQNSKPAQTSKPVDQALNTLRAIGNSRKANSVNAA